MVWHKYYLHDFPIGVKGRPYLYGTLKACKGCESIKVARFFRHKVVGEYVYVHDEEVRDVINTPMYDFQFPMEVQ